MQTKNERRLMKSKNRLYLVTAKHLSKLPNQKIKNVNVSVKLKRKKSSRFKRSRKSFRRRKSRIYHLLNQNRKMRRKKCPQRFRKRPQNFQRIFQVLIKNKMEELKMNLTYLLQGKSALLQKKRSMRLF